jgi:hypothetical protein
MIGPIPEGLRKDVKPYAIAENAFTELTNAFQYRGRVVRRQGYSLLGRLTNNTPVMGLRTRELFALNAQQLIAFDTTNAYTYDAGTTSFIALPSIVPTVWSGTDYQFFWTTNYAGGFWATNSKPGLHGYAVSLFAGAVAGPPSTVNVTAVGNTFQVGDVVYFLNLTGAGAANNLTFGTVTAAGNPFTISNPGTNIFTNGAVTSGIALSSTVNIAGQDGIRYYGDLSIGASWANYNPPIDANTALMGCLMIFPYRGYLVFLNTTEGNEAGFENFGNRARWTQIGTPYYSEPVPTTPNQQSADEKAVRDDLFGRGGANDAPTSEVIISAAFIRDVLIVYFERSTWRLRFVNNAQNPFVWERINVELGSGCTFSSVPFDKGAMTIGNRGILISDGNDSVRFDEKIPNDIFQIRQSENGLQRVYGIRTFRSRLTYWTFPDSSHGNGKFPDKVLVYNYETKNWSYFDDCFTCFGYFYADSANLGERWIDLTQPWSYYSDKTCELNISAAGQETIIAGNQQGFVFKLEQESAQNSPSLYISNIVGNVISSPNNNLPNGTWIKITQLSGTTSDDGVSLNGRNFRVANDGVSANDFTLQEFEPISGGNAIGTSFPTTGTFKINYIPILPKSVQINIGALEFKDSAGDGILRTNPSSSNTGVIDYLTGDLSLTFNPPLGIATAVYIRVVSVSQQQDIEPVELTGVWGADGLITKISNIDIQTKIFNFFNEDAGTRLGYIDFYTNRSDDGQFTCNVFGDSSNVPINTPLSDNPQSNVVLTTKNPYQIATGDQTIYRLFADANAQTLQLQLTLSDQQMAVDAINDEDIEILAMMFTIRDKGRLV